MLYRLATSQDVEELCRLNTLFNGSGETTIECARECLENNPQEVVIVAQEQDHLVGFVCVQLKKSFCYRNVQPEIAEVFVEKEYRRRGIARKMLSFAEEYCGSHVSLRRFDLLTGRTNTAAQKLYEACGYEKADTVHMKKRI